MSVIEGAITDLSAAAPPQSAAQFGLPRCSLADDEKKSFDRISCVLASTDDATADGRRVPVSPPIDHREAGVIE